MHHRLGQLLDYIEAHVTSLVERLNNALCCFQDITNFGVHRGAMVALIMGESCFTASRTSWVILHPFWMKGWKTC